MGAKPGTLFFEVKLTKNGFKPKKALAKQTFNSRAPYIASEPPRQEPFGRMPEVGLQAYVFLVIQETAHIGPQGGVRFSFEAIDEGE